MSLCLERSSPFTILKHLGVKPMFTLWRIQESRATECVLVGYTATSKNCILYIPAQQKYIQQAKHVEFIENSVARKQPTVRKVEEVIPTVLPAAEAEEDITISMYENHAKTAHVLLNMMPIMKSVIAKVPETRR